MSDLIRLDVAVEAAEKVLPVKNKFQEVAYNIFLNAAVILSLAAIIMTVVLYSNQLGVCKVYNLPAECIELDLKSYLPLVKHLCGSAMFILFYIIDLKASSLLKKYSFSFLRVFWGFYAIWLLLKGYHLDRIAGELAIILVAIGIPVIVEMLFKVRHRPFKNKPVHPAEYDIAIEGEVYNAILYTYNHKGVISIIMLIVLLAPHFGTWVSRANTQYQVCHYNDVFYAVIMDYPEKLLIQHAVEEESSLSIDTSSYQYIGKTDVELEYREYDSVIIK